jgi:hypothetical protein
MQYRCGLMKMMMMEVPETANNNISNILKLVLDSVFSRAITHALRCGEPTPQARKLALYGHRIASMPR